MYYFEQTARYEQVFTNLLKMRAEILSLFAVVAIATMAIPFAYASSPTQIEMTSDGNTEIDLAWNEGDRIVRSWTSISNFNPSDGSFTMQIIQADTGKVVADSTIKVFTPSKSSAIDINSFVMYMVNAEDICQNEEFDSETSALEECDPLLGEYEMRVLTNDGSSVGTTTFTIIDSRF